jgi:hypothetical protein
MGSLSDLAPASARSHLSGERHDSRSPERTRQLGEDRQIGSGIHGGVNLVPVVPVALPGRGAGR